MSENTIHNTNEKSTINENSEILINILRVLTMLQNALNRLMRKNYFDRSQYPEEYVIIESFILQMRAWINNYKFLSGTENYSCLSTILLSELCTMIINLIDIVASSKG